MNTSRIHSRGRLDERGVALPLAILGLIFVTFLFVGLMFTSGTEAAIGSAHQDAVRSLHSADGAIHAFVAEVVQDERDLVPESGRWIYAREGLGEVPYMMNITRLSLNQEEFDLAYDAEGNVAQVPSVRQTEVFSIRSRHADDAELRGRRGVGALVQAVKTWTFVNFNVDGGVSIGGELSVDGAAQISAYSDLCADSTGVAIKHTSDVDESQIDVDSSKVEAEGGMEQYENLTREELIEHVLGGVGFDDLAREAEIVFNEDNPYQSNNTVSSVDRELAHRYNWGCPSGIGADCGSDPDVAEAAQDYHPIVFIDAGNATGNQRPHIQNRFGQGVLLVRGNVRISAQFLYQGIVIVDGTVTITGGGGQNTGGDHRIEGALVATGGAELEDGSQIAGSAVVRLNQCMLGDLQERLRDGAGRDITHHFERGPFGWFEIVR